MKPKLLLGIFIAVSIVDLCLQLADSQELMRFTRPLLMPVLLYFVYESSKGKVTIRILLLSLAILLFWIGDVLSLYEGQWYFVLKLSLYSLAHVIAGLVLFQTTYYAPKFELIKTLPFIVYALLFLAFLLPSISALKALVIVYSLAITGMAGVASLRKGVTSQISYQLGVYSSLLFIASDSILIANAF
ncbi:MAG: lysoplasmalogenase family protein, partial [Bacteroidota bacterium]